VGFLRDVGWTWGAVACGAVRTFTLDEAQTLLPELRLLATQLVALRARLTVARSGGDPDRPDDPAGAAPPPADVKAMEAQLADLLDRIGRLGVEVKGWAPLLVDFPMVVGDRLLLLCWLEGEADLAWFHDADHGFAGRRPLADLPVIA
jgi:hypothetical protein